MSIKVATLQQDKSKRNGNKYVMSTNFTGMMRITESECNSKKPRYFIRELRFKWLKNYKKNQETSTYISLHTQVGVYTVFIPSNGVY